MLHQIFQNRTQINIMHIFKSDLKNIEIDRKENKDFWLCDLIMVYDDYKVHAEFESTGIKKLIRLFTYLQKMVRGEIVYRLFLIHNSLNLSNHTIHLYS